MKLVRIFIIVFIWSKSLFISAQAITLYNQDYCTCQKILNELNQSETIGLITNYAPEVLYPQKGDIKEFFKNKGVQPTKEFQLFKIFVDTEDKVNCIFLLNKVEVKADIKLIVELIKNNFIFRSPTIRNKKVVSSITLRI